LGLVTNSSAGNGGVNCCGASVWHFAWTSVLVAVVTVGLSKQHCGIAVSGEKPSPIGAGTATEKLQMQKKPENPILARVSEGLSIPFFVAFK
jgi:hypothetical protein